MPAPHGAENGDEYVLQKILAGLAISRAGEKQGVSGRSKAPDQFGLGDGVARRYLLRQINGINSAAHGRQFHRSTMRGRLRVRAQAYKYPTFASRMP